MNTIDTINRINQIKELNTLSAINQINPVRPINPINNKLKEVTDTVTSSLVDYNNPLEINSLADALFNTDARKLKYGKATGTVLRAAWDHIKEHAIDPMSEGDWSTVGLNTLSSFSEDMDLFARPFKALTIGGKEAAAQDRARNRSDYGGLLGNVTGATAGAIAGAVIGTVVFPGLGTAAGAAIGGAIGGTAGSLVGLISGEITDSFFADKEADNSQLVGRINYDYDTGNFFSDMALEIVSDPTGWVDLITNIVTLGTSGAAKITATTATKTAAKIAREAGESLSKRATKTISKGLKKTLKQTTKEAAETPIKTVGDAINLLKGTHAYKALSKEPLSDHTFKYLSDLKLNKIISDDTIKLYNRTSTILNTLDQMSNGIEIKPFSKIDRAPAYFRNYKMKIGGIDTSRGLLKFSSLGNPISASVYLGSRFIKPLSGLSKSSRIKYLMTHTDGIDPATGAINSEKYAKVFTTAATADATFRLLFNETDSADLNLLLERMTKKSVETIHDKIVEFTSKINKAETAVEKFAEAQKLSSYLDSVFGTDTSKLSPEDLIRRIFNKYAPGTNAEELNSYIKSISTELENIKQEVDVLKIKETTELKLREELRQLTQLKENIKIISNTTKQKPNLFNLLNYYKIVLEDIPLTLKTEKSLKNSLKNIISNQASVYKNYFPNLDEILLNYTKETQELTSEQILELFKVSQQIDLRYLRQYTGDPDITFNDLYKLYKNDNESKYLFSKLFIFISENLDIKINSNKALKKYNSILNRLNEIHQQLKSIDKDLKDFKELLNKNKGIIKPSEVKIRVYKSDITNKKELFYLLPQFSETDEYIDIPYKSLIFSTIKDQSDFYDEQTISNAIDTLLNTNTDDYAYNAAYEIINELNIIFKNNQSLFKNNKPLDILNSIDFYKRFKTFGTESEISAYLEKLKKDSYTLYKKITQENIDSISNQIHFSIVKKISNDEVIKLFDTINLIEPYIDALTSVDTSSELKTLLNITEDDFIKKFPKAKNTWPYYETVFKNISNMFKDAKALNIFRKNIESYVNAYLKTITDQNVSATLIINTILSNLQHLYKVDTNLIKTCTSPELLDIKTKFFTNIDTALYSSTIHQRYDQSAVADKLGIKVSGDLHTAAEDTKLTETIFNTLKSKNPTIVSDVIIDETTIKKPKIFFDTETTTLRENTDFREIYLKLEGDDNPGCMLYFNVDEATYNSFSRDFKIKLLQLSEKEADELSYTDWYNKKFIPTISTNTKGTYKELIEPQSDLKNLLTLYEYLKTYCVDANGKIDFTPVGFNSNKFDNIRIYNLIQRVLNDTTLDGSSKEKLDVLASLFSPNSTQMKTAIDVYQLFLKWELGILQLNSATKWEILRYLTNYADIKSPTTSLISFDLYSLRQYFSDLRALCNDNNYNIQEISDITSKLFDNITTSYKQTYIQLPSKYEVVYTPINGEEQHFISLESFYSVKNANLYDGIASETTKNIFNDNVFKFFKESDAFKNNVLGSKFHSRVPYKVTNAILEIAGKYKYTARLKDADVIAELKRAFKFLTEIDKDTGSPIHGKSIAFIEHMQEPADPVELMAAVQYLTPKEYTPYVISSVNENLIEFFRTNNFPLIADIFERQTLYQKNNNKIIYDYGNQILNDSLNIKNEIGIAEQVLRTSEDTDSLSTRRYLAMSSSLSALNKHIEPTIDYFNAVQRSAKAKTAYNEYVEDYLKEIYDNIIKNISELNDEQLITFYLQQGRVIAFQGDSANPILTNLLRRLESNKNFIVTLVELDNGDSIYWTGLRKSVQSYYSTKTGKYRLSKFGKELEPVTIDLGPADRLIDPKDNALLSKLRTSQENNIKYFNTFIDENNYSGYTFNPKGVITSEARFTSIFDKAPKEFLDELPTKEILLSPKNINWSNPFNLSFNLIGSNQFKKIHFGIQDPTDLFSSYYQGIRTVIQKQTTKQQVGAIFESALGYTSFNKFSNPDFDIVKAKEMADYAAEHPEYRLYSRVTYKNKQGKTIDKIITLPNSEYTIMEVFNKGYTVSLETVQNGSVMMDVFNYKIDNSVFNTANLILRLFKIVTLASVGSIMRNSLDSYLKNVEDMGVVDATINTYKAMVIKHNWHKCYKEILLNSQFEINFINPKWWENSVHLYFNGAEKHGMDELTFMYLYSFFNDGPSSAILQDLEIVKNYRTAYTFGTGKATATVPNLQKWYKTNKRSINPKTFEKQNEEFLNKMFSTLIAPNIYVEQVNRLAMFLKYTEDGYLNTTQIYKKIADTHFDFTYKNNFHKIMELLIPFYSFTKDNALFWLRVAENNPIFFKRLIDMMTPIMDLDDYTKDELEYNKSLINQIRTGQIKIMPDADLTLKINPSFLDVLNIFTNPVEALEQRLVSPAALALKHAEQFIVQNQYGGYTIDNGDILNMLPAIGTINVRIEAIKRNLERIEKKQLTDTQRLAAKPFAAISSTFGVTQRYPIYKYETDRYYSTRSSRYYKNNTALYKSGISTRPKKIYYPMEKPAQYSNAYYKFLYIKSLQRYFNT